MNSVLDFSKIKKAIQESGFDGTLTFEMSPECSAKESLEYIRRLMSLS